MLFSGKLVKRKFYFIKFKQIFSGIITKRKMMSISVLPIRYEQAETFGLYFLAALLN